MSLIIIFILSKELGYLLSLGYTMIHNLFCVNILIYYNKKMTHFINEILKYVHIVLGSMSQLVIQNG